MEPYKVYLHLELLDAMPRRAAQKGKILQFIRSLADDPFMPGDFTDKDRSLRVRQVKIIADYAITYWADHPVKMVVVVDIRKAD